MQTCCFVDGGLGNEVLRPTRITLYILTIFLFEFIVDNGSSSILDNVLSAHSLIVPVGGGNSGQIPTLRKFK